jgi:hypothetical protein
MFELPWELEDLLILLLVAPLALQDGYSELDLNGFTAS